jgi:biotin synthase-related radical SAM superfamily protein
MESIKKFLDEQNKPERICFKQIFSIGTVKEIALEINKNGIRCKMYICISSLKSDRIVKNMGKLAVLN